MSSCHIRDQFSFYSTSFRIVWIELEEHATLTSILSKGGKSQVEHHVKVQLDLITWIRCPKL